MIDYDNPPPGLFVYRSRAHFDDLDALWVMHHSRYLVHLERAQQAMFDQLMQTTGFDPQKYPDLYVVVSRIEMDFIKPVKGVGDFLIALHVKRLREAGLSVNFEFRTSDGTEFYASGIRTVCKLSLKNHQPTGWSPQFREIYSQWEQWGRELAAEG